MIKKVSENYQSKKWKKTVKSLLVSMVLLMAFTSVSFAEGGGRYKVDPWAFGVMADTQWTLVDTFLQDDEGNWVLDDEGNYISIASGDPEGLNPEYVSAALARAVEDEFIEYGVKFVIQLGDLTNWAGDAGMEARAAAAQPLIDNEIGFFPLRGNHETYGDMVWRDPELDMNVPAYRTAFPQTQGLANKFGTDNFSSPDIDSRLNGLSYSFDFGDQDNNARFVIVDVEKTSYEISILPVHPDYGQGYYFSNDYNWEVYKCDVDVLDYKGNIMPAGTWFRLSGGLPKASFYGTAPTDETVELESVSSSGTQFWPGDQQDWISAQLDKDTRGTEHAFVLSHRGLMGANHADGFFGSSPAVSEDDQNVFYSTLADNGVKYMLSGHDHLHNRALVASPDGAKQVQQIIHMAASSKFYAPATLDGFSDTKSREIQISQDLYNVGYYIYTIDGPRVNVDYYADSKGNFLNDADYPHGDDSDYGRLYLPNLNFIKKESFGYSTNGEQFLIATGGSYTVVEDTFEDGTTIAKILAGTNISLSTDYTPVKYIDENDPETPDDASDDTPHPELSAPRALNKTVNTGWVANPDAYKFKSDILSLWGMSEIGTEELTDTYVLSMSLNWRRMTHLGAGCIGIATYVDGEWVNAVDENFGGEKNFVVGPYSAEYGLGTYGMDPSTKTAWAVLNYNADFAVAMDIESVPGQTKNRNRKNGK